MHITEANVQAWLEESKLEVGTLDEAMELQISSEVLGRIAPFGYDVSVWTDSTSTPVLVKKVIAMLYAGWYYDRMYSETADTNQYAQRLKRAANELLEGIILGSVDISEVPGYQGNAQPLFWPNDASSVAGPNEFEVGDGPAAFSMGAQF